MSYSRDEFLFTALNIASSRNKKLFAKKEEIDFVIYGHYILKGKQNNPEVVINFNIWSKGKETNIFEEVFNTTTGPEIFDVVDQMIVSSLKKL